MILTEASPISVEGNAFKNVGIYNKEQASSWKKVVDAVHQKGGKIVI